MITRRDTRTVYVGGVPIGGGNPIRIQSMCNTRTEDVKATVEQILRLERAGCEIIRAAVPTMEAARALKEIKDRFIFLWWRISILTIAWPLLPWKMERIKSASIPAI